MTFVEVMVYAVVFLIILGFITHLLWGTRQAETGRKRLGIFQDLRLSSQKINLALSHATRILFPPADGKSYHQIVFLSEQGELLVIYLNDKDQLHSKRINNPSISGDLQACAVEILRKQGVQFGF